MLFLLCCLLLHQIGEFVEGNAPTIQAYDGGIQLYYCSNTNEFMKSFKVTSFLTYSGKPFTGEDCNAESGFSYSSCPIASVPTAPNTIVMNSTSPAFTRINDYRIYQCVTGYQWLSLEKFRHTECFKGIWTEILDICVEEFKLPKSCVDLQNLGLNKDRWYNLIPSGIITDPVQQIRCDLNTSGGYWTHVARNENKTAYPANMNDNYISSDSKTWFIGLTNLLRFTINETSNTFLPFILMVRVETSSKTYYAVYSNFSVSSTGKLISLDTYHGDAGDALSSYVSADIDQTAFWWGGATVNPFYNVSSGFFGTYAKWGIFNDSSNIMSLFIRPQYKDELFSCPPILGIEPYWQNTTGVIDSFRRENSTVTYQCIGEAMMEGYGKPAEERVASDYYICQNSSSGVMKWNNTRNATLPCSLMCPQGYVLSKSGLTCYYISNDTVENVMNASLSCQKKLGTLYLPEDANEIKDYLVKDNVKYFSAWDLSMYSSERNSCPSGSFLPPNIGRIWQSRQMETPFRSELKMQFHIRIKESLMVGQSYFESNIADITDNFACHSFDNSDCASTNLKKEVGKCGVVMKPSDILFQQYNQTLNYICMSPGKCRQNFVTSPFKNVGCYMWSSSSLTQDFFERVHLCNSHGSSLPTPVSNESFIALIALAKQKAVNLNLNFVAFYLGLYNNNGNWNSFGLYNVGSDIITILGTNQSLYRVMAVDNTGNYTIIPSNGPSDLSLAKVNGILLTDANFYSLCQNHGVTDCYFPPPVITNANTTLLNTTTVTVIDKYNYTCNSGYFVDGNRSLTVQTAQCYGPFGGWRAHTLRPCSLVKVCQGKEYALPSSLMTLHNATYTNSQEFLGNISYTCPSGIFTTSLKSTQILYCQEDSTSVKLDGQPMFSQFQYKTSAGSSTVENCTVCDVLNGSFANAYIENNKTFSIGEIAIIKCQTGFLWAFQNDTQNISCLETGWPTIQPCYRACTSNPPTPVNSSLVMGTITSQKVNATVEYTCQPEMYLVPSAQYPEVANATNVTCSETATWTLEKVNQELLCFRMCDAPPVATNSSGNNWDGFTRFNGTQITYNCSTAYLFGNHNDSYNFICNGTSWYPSVTKDQLTCKEVCATAPPLNFGGAFPGTNVTIGLEGEVVNYTCPDGEADKTGINMVNISCHSGNWTNPAVNITCLKGACAAPPSNISGALPQNNITLGGNGQVLNYSCPNGTADKTGIRVVNLICQSGNWTKPSANIKCEIGDVENPLVYRGNFAERKSRMARWRAISGEVTLTDTLIWEMSTKIKIKSGHTVEVMSKEEFARISKDFPMYDGIVRLYPGGWFMLSNCPKIFDKIYEFDFRPTDTIVMTYPKSGTTWMQEIVWTLLHNPDLKNEKANIISDLRSPHLEVDSILLSKKVPRFPSENPINQYIRKVAPHRANDDEKVFAFLEHQPNPRVIKTHLPLDLLPPTMLQNSKVIYLTRDPRDVIISKYHFFRVLLLHSYSGTLDDFINYMINEEQINHPYWLHIKLAYDLRHHPNLLFLYYEDLLENPTKIITDVSRFLGLNRTDEEIKNVVEFTNFKNMRKRIQEGKVSAPMSDGGRLYTNVKENDDGRAFYRKGKAGDWKQSFSQEQVKKINVWMEKNLKGFPNDFKYKV